MYIFTLDSFLSQAFFFNENQAHCGRFLELCCSRLHQSTYSQWVLKCESIDYKGELLKSTGKAKQNSVLSLQIVQTDNPHVS